MLGAGYTLAKEGHVRLDVFYREARRANKSKDQSGWVRDISAAVLHCKF